MQTINSTLIKYGIHVLDGGVLPTAALACVVVIIHVIGYCSDR